MHDYLYPIYQLKWGLAYGGLIGSYVCPKCRVNLGHPIKPLYFKNLSYDPAKDLVHAFSLAITHRVVWHAYPMDNYKLTQ